MLYSDKSVRDTTPHPWAGNTEWNWDGDYYFLVC
jgi:hypothetical protein